MALTCLMIASCIQPVPAREDLLNSWRGVDQEVRKGVIVDVQLAWKSPNQPEHNTTYRITLKGHWFLNERPLELHGLNDKYAFKLKRSTPDGAWAMADVRRIVGGDYKSQQSSRAGLLALLGLQLFMLPETSLIDLLESPNLKRCDIQVVNDGLQLDFTAANPKRISGYPMHGKVLLFNKPPYLPKEAASTLQFLPGEALEHNERYVRKYLYHQSNTLGLMEVSSTGNRDDNGADTGYDRYKVSYSSRPNLSAADFYLSAFGLEEPFGVSFPQPTPWFLYAGITAGAIILLVVLLGLWQKRMQAKAA